MITILLVVVGVAVLIAASPIFKKLFFASKDTLEARVNTMADAIKAADPVAKYKMQIEKSKEDFKNSRVVLESSAKQITSLSQQVAANEKDVAALEKRITNVMAQNDPNGTAKKYATRLIQVKKDLELNRQQLADAEAIYQNNLTLLNRHQQAIEDAQREAENLAISLGQSEMQKNISDMTNKLKESLGTSDLAETKKIIQDQINANHASVRAARDLSINALDELDEELDVNNEVDELLAKFRNPGIEISPRNPPARPLPPVPESASVSPNSLESVQS